VLCRQLVDHGTALGLNPLATRSGPCQGKSLRPPSHTQNNGRGAANEPTVFTQDKPPETWHKRPGQRAVKPEAKPAKTQLP